MPQRQFWTAQHPVGVRWQYDTDPRHPEAESTLLMRVVDQAGKPIEQHSAKVPNNVLHEAVHDLLVVTWDAYLFGEPGDPVEAYKDKLKLWRAYSADRRAV